MATAERATTSTGRPTNRFFADPLRDYARQRLGQPVSVLQAGCLAPTRELGIRQLTEGGFDISVTALDADDPLPQSVLRDTGAGYSDVIVGDLRTAPIPQRKYDIVYCARLIERVQHVELVLDRLVGALKPGGLLLLRTADRYSAVGLLDRLLPQAARKAIWSRLHPGVPGPFPAVYEKVACDQGITSYVTRRGLVIVSRGRELTLREHQARISSAVRISCAAISLLTRRRFSARHDELLYVIRKPQYSFARVV
jgi:SAM-dependent methyltransferase